MQTRFSAKPDLYRIGKYYPGLVLCKVPESCACLAEDSETERPVFLTYLSEQIPRYHRLQRLFIANAKRWAARSNTGFGFGDIDLAGERLSGSRKQERRYICSACGRDISAEIRLLNLRDSARCSCNQEIRYLPAKKKKRIPILIQPFQDHIAFSNLSRSLTSAQTRISARLLCRLIFATAEELLRLEKDQIRFEMNPSAMRLNDDGTIRVYPVFSAKSKRRKKSQVLRFVAEYFSPAASCLLSLSQELDSFIRHQDRHTFKKLKAAAADPLELQVWILSNMLRTDSSEDFHDIQRISATFDHKAAAPSPMSVYKESAQTLQPAPDVEVIGRPGRSYLVYFLLLGLLVLLAIPAGYLLSSRSAARQLPMDQVRRLPRNSAPVIRQAPHELYRKTKDPVATVLVFVDKDGTIKDFNFKNATTKQQQEYEAYIRRILFHPAVSEGRVTGAWTLIKIPLKKE